ncbi:PRC-barrel domain-containing protein [Streptomyces boluensis]|uniref:PRC-barrel domain containing protein n=1 Tax=Streptomyces boluensis TaxID=1775135 RepID=A0A964USK0_9ACTN|nr:PRC-barrel domain-containing protein [Streptomyces boluensis]NBE50925.1 PRC-barrel domain containing protein [Streptomyces boluensis]
MTEDMWGYQPESGYRQGVDLTGFKVEATDGHIGKVDEHSDEAGAAYLVVDTGVWIFGRHILLPAKTIERIDADRHTVHVNRTKAEIKDAPEFQRGEEAHREPTYLDQFAKYYRQPHM